MALPKLKEKVFTHFLKGIKKEVRFRGFTTKEQEILLECIPNDKKELTKKQELKITEAVCQIVSNCIVDDIDVKSLTYFDLIDMFIQLRKVSVSDVIELKYQLTHTDVEDERLRYEVVTHNIDLDKVDVNVPDDSKRIITIDNDQNLEYYVQMKYPTIKDMINDSKTEIKTNIIATKLYSMVESVVVDDEIYKQEDFTLEEWIETFDSFGAFNQAKFVDFIRNIPDVEYEFDIVSVRNPEVKHTVKLKGLADFF